MGLELPDMGELTMPDITGVSTRSKDGKSRAM